MIKLSYRLDSISKYIENNDRIMDIGCDHALLDIYVTQNKKNTYCIASDINPNALNNALENIKKYDLINSIDIRCSNGLEALNKEDNINTIIISGMGHQTILKILKEGKQKLKNIDKLIIQSNTFPSIIRKNVIKYGYYIFDEELVKENNKTYTILIFKRGRKMYSKKEIEYGPILLKNKDKIFKESIDINIKKDKILLSIIPRKYLLKRLKISKELKSLLNEKNSW